MGRIKTSFMCINAEPIYVGDKFWMKEHLNSECCEHWIKCEVKESSICASGFGLFRVDNGQLHCNAAIANYRV